MPRCLLVNFTNPSGMVTVAVMRFGKWDKVIGLCYVPVGAMLDEPKTIVTIFTGFLLIFISSIF